MIHTDTTDFGLPHLSGVWCVRTLFPFANFFITAHELADDLPADRGAGGRTADRGAGKRTADRGAGECMVDCGAGGDTTVDRWGGTKYLSASVICLFWPTNASAQ